MFKKPFNRKDGEDRICMDCGNGFHTMQPTNRCNECKKIWTRNRQKEKLELGLIEKHTPKENYPFGTQNGEAARRFKRIQKGLNKCFSREERREYYNNQLREAEELGILTWIYDRRDSESNSEGRVKRETKIKKEYPDTRNIDWEEFERGGWGDIEDS